MIKVKTMKFVGSRNTHKCGLDANFKEYHSPKEIDEDINNFIEKEVAELIDIKITAIESKTNGNGYNDVDLIYTIIYKAK